LWRVLMNSRGNAGQRLRAACALAAYDATNPRWAQVGCAVVDKLLTESPLQIGKWQEALRPIAGTLVAPLAETFRDATRPESERYLAVNLLADYAAEQPEVLAEQSQEADPRAFAILLPNLHRHRDAAPAAPHREL